MYVEGIEGNYANRDYVGLRFAFTTSTGKVITGDYTSYQKDKATLTLKSIKVILSDIYLNMVR